MNLILNAETGFDLLRHERSCGRIPEDKDPQKKIPVFRWFDNGLGLHRLKRHEGDALVLPFLGQISARGDKDTRGLVGESRRGSVPKGRDSSVSISTTSGFNMPGFLQAAPKPAV